MKKQKNSIVTVILILTVLLIVGGGVYIYKNKKISTQTSSGATAFLEEIQAKLGAQYKIQATGGYEGMSGYEISLPQDQFNKASDHLASKFGVENNKYTSERSVGFEDWHLLCLATGLGSGSSPTDLPYIWCADKVGVQTVEVIVKDVKNTNTDTRTFMLTLGKETLQVRMPAIVQNVDYKEASFVEFVKSVTDKSFETTTFQMTGELKENIFEVSKVQWILG
ncbi:MAG: hypothetical protein V4697_00005 [Patescibacteria group bacterium]